MIRRKVLALAPLLIARLTYAGEPAPEGEPRVKAGLTARVRVLEVMGGWSDELGVLEYYARAEVLASEEGDAREGDILRFNYVCFAYEPPESSPRIEPGGEYTVSLTPSRGLIRFASDAELMPTYQLADLRYGAAPYPEHLKQVAPTPRKGKRWPPRCPVYWPDAADSPSPPIEGGAAPEYGDSLAALQRLYPDRDEVFYLDALFAQGDYLEAYSILRRLAYRRPEALFALGPDRITRRRGFAALRREVERGVEVGLLGDEAKALLGYYLLLGGRSARARRVFSSLSGAGSPHPVAEALLDGVPLAQKELLTIRDGFGVIFTPAKAGGDPLDFAFTFTGAYVRRGISYELQSTLVPSAAAPSRTELSIVGLGLSYRGVRQARLSPFFGVGLEVISREAPLQTLLDPRAFLSFGASARAGLEHNLVPYRMPGAPWPFRKGEFYLGAEIVAHLAFSREGFSPLTVSSTLGARF